jgi:molybdopterin converting factor small subunit
LSDGAGGGDVTLLFFASAREATGVARASIDGAGRTVDEVVGRVCQIYGADLGKVLAVGSVWVNGERAQPAQTLAAGDEVAILPPVSGG